MTGPIGSAAKVYEKNITLSVARELRAALERRGVTVVMTRNSDTLIALGDRGRIANEAKADLFMSVHVNAAERVARLRARLASKGFCIFPGSAPTPGQHRPTSAAGGRAKRPY